MHVETRYFLIFQNIFRIKNFRNCTNFFSGSPKYYFLGTFNEIFLTFSSLACNIFSKNSWFLFLDKLQVQKNVNVITCFFCNVIKQKLRSNWNPPPHLTPPHHCQCYISLSVWCVFCSFTPFLSVLFVFHRKSLVLVLLHLMHRYTASRIKHFFKRKYIVESKKKKTSKTEVEVKVGGNRKKGLEKIWWDGQ